MKKIFKIGLLFSFIASNLQAAPSLLTKQNEDFTQVSSQKRNVPSIVPPIALALISTITGVPGLILGGILLTRTIPDVLDTSYQDSYEGKKVMIFMGMSAMTPLLLEISIASGLYAVKKFMEISRLKKAKQSSTIIKQKKI